MKIHNSRGLIRILSLIMALCMVIGCFAGCSKNSESGKKKNEKDIRDDLDDYTLNGLTYYIGEDFGRNESNLDDSAHHTNDDEDMEINIFCGAIDDVAGNLNDTKIRNSKDFAKAFAEFMREEYKCDVDSANGIYYTIFEIPGEGVQVCGFYVEDDYGWIIMANSEDEDDEEDLINYATLGQIDKDFDSDDYISHDDDDAYDYEDDYEEDYADAYEEPTLPPSPESDTFTVYAYIPGAWGYPGIWAWSNTTGENVFDAWPGQPMDYYDGFLYTYELPCWVEYLIINGNEGTIQTEDEPIQSYEGVWVIVNADGQSYGIYFSEPTEQDFRDHGY